MRIGILDFGTNTFNLLIAEKSGTSFNTIYSGKQAVQLGKGGIVKGVITPEAMERGFKAIEQHMNRIWEFDVDDLWAFGTSAFRTTKNGQEYADQIQERFGFLVNIIDGEEEARLIYRGIMESVNLEQETAMIMDIGGGSVEFIICNQQGILWKQSFELGMARMIDMLEIPDPISEQRITDLEVIYKTSLEALFLAVKEHNPTLLIGASGTFDTLAAMAVETLGKPHDPDATSMEISPLVFADLYQLLISSTAAQRREMKGMEPVRVEMIVPAVIFINFVLKTFHISSIKQSGYALKEGVMSHLVKKA